MKTYYIAKNEYLDEIYDDQPILCFDANMVRDLAEANEMTVEEYRMMFRTATREEIGMYGVIDSPVAYHDYKLLCDAAKANQDRNAFIREHAVHPLWRDFEGDEIPEQRLEYLGFVWDSIRFDLTELLPRIGMTMAEFLRCHLDEFAPEFDGWCNDPSTIPDFDRNWVVERLYSFYLPA